MPHRLPYILLPLLLASTPALSQDSLRILTWNIQMLPAFVNNNGKARRSRVIVDQLKALNYDIVVFQEIFKRRSRRIIRKGLAGQFPYHTQVLNKKTFTLKTNGGVMLFSRYPITDVHQIQYRKRTGFDKLSRKGALLAELDINGKHIQVAGTHMQAFAQEDVLYSQYHQLNDELLKPHTKSNVPQLICGDFNTRKTSNIPAAISAEGSILQTRYQYMLQTLGASDGELEGDLQFTMDRPNNDLCMGNKQARLLLDYIFVRSDESNLLTVTRQVKVIRQSWSKNHRDLSDHFGIEAIVTLNGMHED